jgi:dolichol-phosphate mannosyltransferase
MSVVIPFFNEEDNVEPLVEQCRAALSGMDRPWELVLVDDGSRDGTWERIRRSGMVTGKVLGLRHLENRGQSVAVWTGIRHTDTALVATLDGDLQNDPADLPSMVERLEVGGWDCVSGLRAEREDAWVRRASSAIASRARQVVLGSPFVDTGCGLRVMRRHCFEDFLAFDGWHRFLPVILADHGWRCLEVPVSHRARRAGQSKYGVRNRLGRGLFDLVGLLWYRRRRLRPAPVSCWRPENRKMDESP